MAIHHPASPEVASKIWETRIISLVVALLISFLSVVVFFWILDQVSSSRQTTSFTPQFILLHESNMISCPGTIRCPIGAHAVSLPIMPAGLKAAADELGNPKPAFSFPTDDVETEIPVTDVRGEFEYWNVGYFQ